MWVCIMMWTEIESRKEEWRRKAWTGGGYISSVDAWGFCVGDMLSVKWCLEGKHWGACCGTAVLLFVNGWMVEHENKQYRWYFALKKTPIHHAPVILATWSLDKSDYTLLARLINILWVPKYHKNTVFI